MPRQRRGNLELKHRDAFQQLRNPPAAQQMLAFALEVSPLWHLPGDGVLVLISFDHHQGRRGARDGLARCTVRTLVRDSCPTHVRTQGNALSFRGGDEEVTTADEPGSS